MLKSFCTNSPFHYALFPNNLESEGFRKFGVQTMSSQQSKYQYPARHQRYSFPLSQQNHHSWCQPRQQWSQGIRSPRYEGIPYVYFNQRKGCPRLLYIKMLKFQTIFLRWFLAQESFMKLKLRCWEHIFDAISNEKHLIYITGWSVFTEITLTRDPKGPKPGGELKLTWGAA